MKLIFGLLLLPMLFVSCSKDDDKDSVELTAEELQLVGTWNAIQVDREEYMNGNLVHEEIFTDIDIQFVFRSNGTVADNEGYEGRFHIVNNQVIISYDDDDDYIYNIVSLNNTELVVLVSYEYVYESDTYKTVEIYTLVKE